MSSVSVITATAGGRLDRLRAKLQALRTCGVAPTSLEWVVCDDGGREPGLERLREERPPFGLKLVVLPTPAGPAAARNAALEVAEGDVLYLSDDDCVPLDAAVSQQLGALAGRADAVGVGGIDFVSEDGSVERWRPRRVGWWQLNGANCAVHRAAVESAGRFDESIVGYGHEDVMLGYELSRSGASFVAVPASVAVHYGQRPMTGADMDKARSAGRNAAQVAGRVPALAGRLGVSRTLLALKTGLLPPLARALGGRFAAELEYARAAAEERRRWER